MEIAAAAIGRAARRREAGGHHEEGDPNVAVVGDWWSVGLLCYCPKGELLRRSARAKALLITSDLIRSAPWKGSLAASSATQRKERSLVVRLLSRDLLAPLGDSRFCLALSSLLVHFEN